MTIPLQCSKCRAPLPLAAYGAQEAVPCPSCASPVRALVFPAFLNRMEAASAEAILDESEAGCFYHPAKKAAVACDGCGRFICSLCEVELEGSRLCPQCLESGKRKGRLGSLEGSRTLYNDLALLTAIVPIITVWLTAVSAPIALYLCLRYRKAPRSLVRPGRWKWWLALLLSILQIAGWALFLVNIPSMTHRARNRHPATPPAQHARPHSQAKRG